MQIDLDHAHIFASDIDATIRWWSEMLGARVVFDLNVAGARNVRLAVGRGAVQFYDQPPRVVGSGSVHHLGIQTDDLDALVASMAAKGAEFREGIKDFGSVRFAMTAAPDVVLIELFEASGLKSTE
ncbi:MAG: VOC family protein [Dehalococcoidia bacterium]|jgi:catechol 2,3-dioxygenase-like lactoylglutathione lyase family enzyme